MTKPAKLALEDGTVFAGTSIGADGEVDGEVCFNTSMTGYQEILTDPSYRGQIVTMTYPQIGNYGVNAEDVESRRPQLAGFVVREHSRTQSNFRSEQSLSEYLRQWGIVAIESIDTRALVRRLRSGGAMKGVLSTVDLDDASLVAKAKASPGLVGRDLVREVLPDQPREWQRAAQRMDASRRPLASRGPSPDTGQLDPQTPAQPHVVALDYGMKWNIPRHLVDMGCRVTILPGTATADDVLATQPGRRVPLERPRRPGAARIRDQHDPRPAGQEADLRHLPGPPTARPGLRREDVQAEVRPPRRESPGAESARPARSRSRRRTTASRSTRIRCPSFLRSHAPQPERRHDRRPRRTATCRPSACSITPKPPPARTTATICSGGSSNRCDS